LKKIFPPYRLLINLDKNESGFIFSDFVFTNSSGHPVLIRDRPPLKILPHTLVLQNGKTQKTEKNSSCHIAPILCHRNECRQEFFWS
jgi:hypothetical protein